jgi:hypothetical protein
VICFSYLYNWTISHIQHRGLVGGMGVM